MWDRDNPYVYSDPSGYCASDGGTSSGADTTGANNPNGIRSIGCVTAKRQVPTLQMMFGSIYVGNDGYIGRTQRFAERAQEWSRVDRIIAEMQAFRTLDKFDDICVEGYIIHCNGIQRKGGRLPNKRNGVTDKTPWGRAQLTRGMEQYEQRMGGPIEINESSGPAVRVAPEEFEMPDLAVPVAVP